MLWWFGNGVGGGDLVVGGRRLTMGVRRCLRGGVVEVKGRRWWWFGVVVWGRCWWWRFGCWGVIGPK